MERLRDSLAELEAPVCPNCHVGMKWFRSELVQDDVQPLIAHLFVCPNCKSAQRRDSKVEAVRIPPKKLLSPRLRVVG
ncbi:uncharacterized protein with PIN domain [Bradyrhizobium sp. USDA 4449]